VDWIRVAHVRDKRRAVVNIRGPRIPCWPGLSPSIVLGYVCVLVSARGQLRTHKDTLPWLGRPSGPSEVQRFFFCIY
jgi:hypothetical protein